jgi:hypothetical protein
MAGRRLEVGFFGGNIVRTTLDEAQVAAMTEALGSDAHWHQVAAEEGSFWIKLSDVQFVRIPGDGPHGVGFSRD